MIGKPVVAKLSGLPFRFLMIKKTLTGGSMTVDFDGSVQIAGSALFIKMILNHYWQAIYWRGWKI